MNAINVGYKYNKQVHLSDAITDFPVDVTDYRILGRKTPATITCLGSSDKRLVTSQIRHRYCALKKHKNLASTALEKIPADMRDRRSIRDLRRAFLDNANTNMVPTSSRRSVLLAISCPAPRISEKHYQTEPLSNIPQIRDSLFSPPRAFFVFPIGRGAAPAWASRKNTGATANVSIKSTFRYSLLVTRRIANIPRGEKRREEAHTNDVGA